MSPKFLAFVVLGMVSFLSIAGAAPANAASVVDCYSYNSAGKPLDQTWYICTEESGKGVYGVEKIYSADFDESGNLLEKSLVQLKEGPYSMKCPNCEIYATDQVIVAAGEFTYNIRLWDMSFPIQSDLGPIKGTIDVDGNTLTLIEKVDPAPIMKHFE